MLCLLIVVALAGTSNQCIRTSIPVPYSAYGLSWLCYLRPLERVHVLANFGGPYLFHVLLTHCVQPARFSFPRVHTCAVLVGVIATPDAVTSSPNVFCSVTGIPSSLSIFTVLVAPCVPLLGSPYTERCCFCPSCTTNISWTPKDPCTADRYHNRYPSSLDVSILPFTYYHFY